MLAVPIILCWLITRDLMLVLEFALTYLGIVLFANIWGYSLAARQHGVIFLAFIASAWAARLSSIGSPLVSLGGWDHF